MSVVPMLASCAALLAGPFSSRKGGALGCFQLCTSHEARAQGRQEMKVVRARSNARVRTGGAGAVKVPLSCSLQHQQAPHLVSSVGTWEPAYPHVTPHFTGLLSGVEHV